MKTTYVLSGLAAATAVAAQRPASDSICDYYTTALLKDNTAKNQQALLTLVVNTAVIGNYTKPNVGIAVPGILTPGMMNGAEVNLAPYFNGMLKSTNDGGASGVSVNFLDDGGAAPLEMNMAANGTSSAQYALLTHLYEYFAVLLGCSEYGSKVMPYAGDTSMYKVHKYMGLDVNEVGYFIQQVGLSAASFGVAKEDVAAVGKALNDAFGYRCAPAASIPPTAKPDLQSICIDESCPVAPNSTCSSYAAVIPPMNATSPANMSMPSSSSMPSSTLTPFKGAASAVVPAVSTLLVAAIGLAVLL